MSSECGCVIISLVVALHLAIVPTLDPTRLRSRSPIRQTSVSAVNRYSIQVHAAFSKLIHNLRAS